MHKSVLLFCVLTAAIVSVLGLVSSVPLEQRCQTLRLIPRRFLSLQKTVGTWYALVMATANTSEVRPLNHKCDTAFVRLTDNPFQLRITSTFIAIENGYPMPRLSTEESLATYDNFPAGVRPGPAVWDKNTTIPGSNNETVHSQSVILAADESEWGVQYQCRLVDDELDERVIIWSRQRTLNPVILHTLETFVFGLGYPRENFQHIDQSQCDSKPEKEPYGDCGRLHIACTESDFKS